MNHVMTSALLAQISLDRVYSDLFLDLGPGQRFVLLLSGIGCLTAAIISVVAVISKAVRSMHRSRLEAQIKRDMLDRGMTAEEIAKVVEAASPKDFLERWASNQASKKSA